MSVWLTRIVPDPRSSAVRRDFRDAVALHQRVMTLVPDGLGTDARHRTGVLFRVEESRAGRQLLVQTRVPPNPARLPDGYGTAAVRELTPLLDALTPGLAVRYRLAANPSKRLGRSASERQGKIVALRGTAAEAWWAARAAACGLSLRTLSAQSMPDITGRTSNGTLVRHGVVRFDGIAIVTDPELLRAAVLAGIGRGKAYGCGLLSLAPLSNR